MLIMIPLLITSNITARELKIDGKGFNFGSERLMEQNRASESCE
jgi:hypothetical protein